MYTERLGHVRREGGERKFIDGIIDVIRRRWVGTRWGGGVDDRGGGVGGGRAWATQLG